MNKLIRYFDLNSKLRALAPTGVAETDDSKSAKAWPQWVALAAGVFIQPSLTKYRATGHWDFSGGWGWLLFAAIVAIIIFPSVYRAAFDAKKPWLVHIAPIFAAGLGWEALFGAAVRAGSQVTGQ